MRSVPKLIRRFVGLLLLSVLLLVAVNVLLLAGIVSRQAGNLGPWRTADTVATALSRKENGYLLADEGAAALSASGAWAILIDNDTKTVVWHSGNLPDSVPMYYTLTDISSLTRGYLDGYPTFTSGTEFGLAVLGFPRTSFWKHMWPSWDYWLIAHAPQIALTVLAVNLLVILLIYGIANARVLSTVKPIICGIQALPSGEPVYVRETGLFSEVAAHINSTSQVLQQQKRELERRETARANWIAGASHDIRTPLSMVIGYADQLQATPGLSREQRHKAGVIVTQGKRMRDLVADLNLASKLEYNMQPLCGKRENAVALVRQVAVDFLNTDGEGKYPIVWLTEETLSVCTVNADRELLKRAVANLIHNCIRHNEKGCTIYISVAAEAGNCVIRVEDDGIGATDAQMEELNAAPHFMVWDENIAGQRHGLGLRIVRQIAEAHHGAAEIGHSRYGGFAVSVILPADPPAQFPDGC